jgi:regulator of PEP synthase PpsR (kinase-PPPase family)
MTKPIRKVFFLSDGTGVTAEVLGQSLLSQFDGIEFDTSTLPFVNTPERVENCMIQLRESVARTEHPVVFATLIDPAARDVIRGSGALVLDFFESHLAPLEREFGAPSSHAIGRSHGNPGRSEYHQRMEAVNFALAHDDGVSDRELSTADIILVGVSRCGKTPTCLYMAMQFGIRAANYPLIPEDFERQQLPTPLRPHIDKTFGLSISAERLSEIRNERRPGSRYAELEACRREIQSAEHLMSRKNIPWLDSTTKSVEEISATIIEQCHIRRRVT